MRRRIVAGNWKMNKTRATAVTLAQGIAKEVGDVTAVKVVVCPPFPYLISVGEAIAGTQVRLGAQNCYFKKEGALTGEVSPSMLVDVGCKYVILGHSERRHQMNESDDSVNQKVRVALDWTLDLLFSKDLVQFLTVRAPAISRVDDSDSMRVVPEIVSTLR